MSWRRLSPFVLTGLVILVALAIVGRSEKRKWVDAQLRGMRRVAGLVGPLDQSLLVGFRALPSFDCLVYRRGANLLALELCVDRSGRLVEAIDRLGVVRHYYDLESDPGAASIRVNRAEVDRLLRKMEAS